MIREIRECKGKDVVWGGLREEGGRVQEFMDAVVHRLAERDATYVVVMESTEGLMAFYRYDRRDNSLED